MYGDGTMGSCTSLDMAMYVCVYKMPRMSHTWGPEEAKWVTQMEMSGPRESLRFPANDAEVEPTRAYFSRQNAHFPALTLTERETRVSIGDRCLPPVGWLMMTRPMRIECSCVESAGFTLTLFSSFSFKIFVSLYLGGPIKAPRPHLQLDLPNIEKENGFSPIYLIL